MAEAFRVVRLPTTELSLPHLLPSRTFSIVPDIRPEVKVEKSEVEETFATQARLSSTTHPDASASQSNANLDRLSIIRDYAKRVGLDVKSAETEEKLRGYLQANLENAHRE